MVILATTDTRNGSVSAFDASFIIVSSLLNSGKLGGKMNSMHHARRIYHLLLMRVNSCFCFLDRLSHKALELAIMTKI